jgi:hypothetical protein
MPDKTTRTLGYTELWERMRRALAVEGDQCDCGWTDEHEPPPGHFSEDGQPRLLLGYVLAGLGVTPEQVVAQLLPHNATEPREIFAAAGFPLTAEAGWLAEGSWLYEIRSVFWSRCIGELREYGPDEPGWVPQDGVTLAEAELARELDQDELDALGVDGMRLQAELGHTVTVADIPQLAPVDVTAITATFPSTPPPELADAPDFRVGFDAWLEAAELATGWTAETVTRSTFEVDSVPVDASSDDDTVCAAILVDYRWYVIERDGDTVRARLVPIDGDEDEDE